MTAKVLAFALALPVTVWAQGTTSGIVNFSNGGIISAPFFDADGTTRLAGAQYRAALYWGPVGSSPEGMVQAGASQPFLTGAGAGFWQGGNRTLTLPGPAPDLRVALQVRFWDSVNSTIASFEHAQAVGAKIGVSMIIQVVLNPMFPVPMTGLQSASLVPTITLTRGAGLVTDSSTPGSGTPLTDICSIPVGLNRWFRLTTPVTGEAHVTTTGSSFDTVIGAYTGSILSPSSLTMLACNDDSSAGTTASDLRFIAQANTLYLICVAGKNGASGTVQLNHTLLTRLRIRRMDSGVELSWPADATNFVAEATSRFPPDWQMITNMPVTLGNRSVVERDCPASNEVFRLRLRN